MSKQRQRERAKLRKRQPAIKPIWKKFYHVTFTHELFQIFGCDVVDGDKIEAQGLVASTTNETHTYMAGGNPVVWLSDDLDSLIKSTDEDIAWIKARPHLFDADDIEELIKHGTLPDRDAYVEVTLPVNDARCAHYTTWVREAGEPERAEVLSPSAQRHWYCWYGDIPREFVTGFGRTLAPFKNEGSRTCWEKYFFPALGIPFVDARVRTNDEKRGSHHPPEVLADIAEDDDPLDGIWTPKPPPGAGVLWRPR